MDGLQQLKRDRIPTKLSDCKIVNSYINIELGTNFNSSYIIEFLINRLNIIFEKTIFQKMPLDTLNTTSIEATKFMYVNKSFKIKIEDNVISINCNQKYPGWSAIYDLLGHTIETLHEIDKDMTFPILGVEYLSAFPGIEIFSKIDGTIKLNCIPIFDNTTFEFNCQIHNPKLSRDDAVGFVRLQNNVPMSKEGKVSLVTIGVQHKNKDREANNVLTDLNIIHYGEKELFFNLIKDEFIQEQGPIYGTVEQ